MEITTSREQQRWIERGEALGRALRALLDRRPSAAASRPARLRRPGRARTRDTALPL